MGCAPSQQQQTNDGKKSSKSDDNTTVEKTRGTSSSSAPSDEKQQQQPSSSSGGGEGPPPHTFHESDKDVAAERDQEGEEQSSARSPPPPEDVRVFSDSSTDGGQPPGPDRTDTVAYMSTSGSNPDMRTVRASGEGSPKARRNNPLNQNSQGEDRVDDTAAPKEETDSPPPPDDPLLDAQSGVIMSDESAGVISSEPSGVLNNTTSGGGGEKGGGDEDGKLLSNSSSTPGMPPIEKSKRDTWNELQGRLPVEKGNSEERERRFALFKDFDPNGNGYLSLAEVDHGCRTILKLHELQDPLQPILIRAFNAAKDARQKRGKGKTVGEDYVEKSEFRLLLVYIKSYFELFIMFDEVDSSEDRRVDEDEFTRSLGKLEQWGVPKIEDPAAAFSAIDTNGGGLILFEEFADWASSLHLSIQSSEEDDDE